MIRRFFNFQYRLTEKGKKLEALRPLIASLDAFFFEPKIATSRPPHVRDAVDLKRWMVLVIVSLLPCIFMAIWNTGLQDLVYSSRDHHLMEEFLSSLTSFRGYFDFVFKEGRWLEILKRGALTFLPVMLISYLVGGIVEAIFAVVRGHELAEGFLVTGMLYPLILPPTIPYWMVALGVAAGIFFAKEVFGGTGHNIMNPALACRAFLFFTFPAKMSGDVWVGTNPTTIRESLLEMNSQAGRVGFDAFTQASSLARFNVSHEIKKIHIDTIGANHLGVDLPNLSVVKNHLDQWAGQGHPDAILGTMGVDQLRDYLTAPLSDGGLGLPSGSFDDAWRLADLTYSFSPINFDSTFFFGNKLGCMGETSTLAVLLGALFLIFTRVGSWRTMLACFLGAFTTAFGFEWGAKLLGMEGGAWVPASFTFPAYKHLIMGGLAFGYVFMSTDPVSSPTTRLGQWIYGALIGLVTITIRVINPAYPEGVMLAIIMGNVFTPLIDHYTSLFERRKYHVLS